MTKESTTLQPLFKPLFLPRRPRCRHVRNHGLHNCRHHQPAPNVQAESSGGQLVENLQVDGQGVAVIATVGGAATGRGRGASVSDDKKKRARPLDRGSTPQLPRSTPACERASERACASALVVARRLTRPCSWRSRRNPESRPRRRRRLLLHPNQESRDHRRQH